MRGLCIAILAANLASCSSLPAQPDVPAVRTSLNRASTLEIQQILSAATNTANVTISDDALALDSTLILEQAPRRGIDNSREPGRNYGRPARFQLVLDGPQCFLVHEETGLRWMLRETLCVAQ